jgi:hypothetical protein
MRHPIPLSFNKHMKFLSHQINNRKLVLLTTALISAFGPQVAQAQPVQTTSGSPITTVFYILLENRNWTNGGDSSAPSQVQGNTAAPYLNAITNPNNASLPDTNVSSSADVSYCSCYHNDLAVANGSGPSIHPSEPNYVWMECGSNLSKADDNDPYGSGNSVQQIYNYAAANPPLTTQNLSGLLEAAGLTWKSYTEGTQLYNTLNVNNTTTSGGTLTNNVVPQASWSVPLVSFSGSNASYTNPYNKSHQWNTAIKHTGQCFFTQTNGSTINTANSTPQNVEAYHYPPLEQLQNDLANGTYANYNVITPDQYNDMHTALTGSYTYTVTASTPLATGVTYTGDLAQVAQGDNFCQIVVPRIQSCAAYQNGTAAIVIWTDETEGTNQNNFGHALTEIVLSKQCKGAAYNSTVNLTHSSDLATMQEIFGLTGNTASGYLNDAANLSNSSGSLAGSALGYGTSVAQDMSDLFKAGAIPAGIPGLNLAAGGYAFNRHTGAYSQNVTVTNTLSTAFTNPVYLLVSNLSSNATLTNSAGTTVNNRAGSQYVLVSQSGLAAGASASVSLQYSNTGGAISSQMSVINTASQP